VSTPSPAAVEAYVEGVDRFLAAREGAEVAFDRAVAADPDFADAQHARIKSVTADVTGVALPVLYGGSVNPQNCRELASKSDIDGLFIGRAAWNADGYIGIIEAVTKGTT